MTSEPGEAPHHRLSAAPSHCAAAPLEGRVTRQRVIADQHVKQPCLFLKPRDPVLAARLRPSYAHSFHPLRKEGARNAGCPVHPLPKRSDAVLRMGMRPGRSETQGKQPGVPYAACFRLLRALPGADWSPSAECVSRGRLTSGTLHFRASSGAGRHDLAGVRGAVRQCLGPRHSQCLSTPPCHAPSAP